MKKQRKLLTTEEKEKICKNRKHICAKNGEVCPLFFEIGVAGFCYKDDINVLEDAIEKVHNEEVEVK